jgi:hypothetical protein
MLFMDYNWENKYPVVSFQALPRIEGLSDHTPILLTTVTLTPPCKRPFKFELAWLHMEGFSDLVKEVWESHVTGRTPIQNWNNKLRATRRFLGGWARHLFGRLKMKNSASHRLSIILRQSFNKTANGARN